MRGDMVLRYNAHSMSLYEDGQGENAGRRVKIGWYTRLRKLVKRPSCVPVWLSHGNQHIRGYLHVIPLPEEKATQARRKAKQRAKDKGRNPRVENLSLSEWVLIFTSLPPEVLSITTASALYRVRWQVE